MEVWGMLVIFAAVAVAAISGESATFPEVARERSNTRIVSGWEATEGQFPYQLSIRMVSALGAVSSCGASIISEEWGLTAAHCTAGRYSFVVRGGVVNLTRPAVMFETTRYYNHPLYNNNLASVVQPNDIGLLEFGRKLVFNDYIKPIRIQRDESKNINYEGVRLIASGWGRTWTNGASPENLNWVYLSGDTNQRCLSQYGSIITEATICASGYNDTTQSTCQGDSGGPLTVIDEDGEITQIGVTSFVSGSGCHTNFPAGFIRPGHYHDWYYEVTGISFDWELETKPTEAPEQVTTKIPEWITTAVPEEVTTVVPEEVTTAVPEEVTTAVPEEVTTVVPEEVTTAVPEEVTTAVPEEVTTAVPEEVTTAVPEEVTTVVPEEVTTAVPEDVNTAVPEEFTTAVPEEVTTAVPEEVTTAVPEEVTTAVPEEVITVVPEEVTTAVPEDVNTAVPEEFTTAVPEEVTTAVPEEVTTVVPEEVTTAVPEEVTTAVPDVEWDPDCEEEATMVHFVNN